MNPQTVDIQEQVTGFFGYTCIGHLVSNAASAVFIISGIAFFTMLVFGGFQWLTAGGSDKGKIETAQKSISNGLIGLAIVAASYAVFTLVLNFFGIDLDALCTTNPLGS